MNNNSNNNLIEVIVKYQGDILYIQNQLELTIDILSYDFAIITLNPEDIEQLQNYNEIIYIELPKILDLSLTKSLVDSCITINNQNVLGLNGKGVLIGIIDSGIREDVNFSQNIKYQLLLNDNQFTEHGTMVATIVNKIAPNSDIAFVSVGNNEFFASTTDIMRGIKFVIDSAQGNPFVINISYGTNSGSHDGSSLFEEYIDEVAQAYICSIVVATGNEADKGRHYQNIFSNKLEIEFNIDRGISISTLELWKNFVDDVQYEIISPQGESSGIFNSRAMFQLGFTTINILITEPSPYNINEQVYIRFNNSSFINSGIWKLVIYGTNIVDGNFNIWSDTATFLSPTTYITLTIPSTANRVISVGAYNSAINAQTNFSGRGFTANNFVKPDIVASGVNVNINNNIYTGTSVATPFVTGSVALLLQWGVINKNDVNLYGERLKAYLRKGAIRDMESYPNKIFGYGRLCLRNTLDLLRNIRSFQNDVSAPYNNDYEEIIVEYSDILINLLNQNNIPYCRVDTGNYVIVYLNRNEYSLINMVSGIIAGVRENSADILGLMDEKLNISANVTLVQRPPLDLSGQDVIVGFVDTGINYKNQEFLYANGENKVYSIWDMTIEENIGDVCFGREFTSEEINSQVADTNDTNGHGTNMAINACGNSGVAPNSTIIAVKLKKAKQYQYDANFINNDVEAYSSADIILGMDYIVKTAKKLNRPLVIILGLGTNFGGHDGSAIIERYIDNIGTQAGISVALPTGNEAVAKHHSLVTIDTDSGYRDVEISVAENVRGFNLQIWNNILTRVEVAIISPTGESISRIPVQNNFSNEYILFQTNSRVKVSYSIPVFQTVSERTNIRFTNPLTGVWKIRIYGNSNGNIHLWLPITSFVGDRVTFLEPSPYNTVTIPATSQNAIIVGGYNVDTGIVLSESGRGPTRNGELRPFLVAPTFSNTSISAAVAGGVSALLMEWGIINGNFYSLNSLTITALLIYGADQSIENIYPNNIEGYGKINLYNVFYNI